MQLCGGLGTLRNKKIEVWEGKGEVYWTMVTRALFIWIGCISAMPYGAIVTEQPQNAKFLRAFSNINNVGKRIHISPWTSGPILKLYPKTPCSDCRHDTRVISTEFHESTQTLLSVPTDMSCAWILHNTSWCFMYISNVRYGENQTHFLHWPVWVYMDWDPLCCIMLIVT